MKMVTMCSLGRGCEVAGSRRTRVVLVFCKAGLYMVRFGEGAKGGEHPKSSHAEIPEVFEMGGFQHCCGNTRFRNTPLCL